jgi:purine catabolism regulator
MQYIIGAERIMTIYELLQMPEFSELKIIAGKDGCSRKINSVNVIDAPDNYIFFKGGEFLLTSTYIMKDDPVMLKDIIENLEKIGAAGIGIKLERFIKVLPEEVIDIANNLSFPIIFIPAHFAFADIINPVLSNIVNSQFEKLQYSERIHNSFTGLVLNGGTYQQIIDTLSSIINKDVIFFNKYFDKVFLSASCSKSMPSFNRSDLKHLKNTHKYYPLEIDKSNYGYIIIIDDESINKEENIDISSFQEIAVEHASTVLKLNIQRQISNFQIESKYRDEFVQELLLGDFTSLEQINEKASLYGWKFNKGIITVIFDISENNLEINKDLGKTHDIFTRIRKTIRSVYPNSIYTNFSQRIIFLIEPTLYDIKLFNLKLNNNLEKLAKDISTNYKVKLIIGVGSFKSSLMDIHHSYNEAQKSVNIGKKIGNEVSFYDNLGLFKILAPVSETDAAKEFCDLYINKIIKYDQVNNTEFFPTLKCFIKHNWNLKEAAKDLFIHYNTAKNRFAKICEILEMDLHDSESRINVTVSLKLLLLNN